MTITLIEDVSQFEPGSTVGFAFKEPESEKDMDGVYLVDAVKGKTISLKNPKEKEKLIKDEILLNGFSWYRIDFKLATDPKKSFEIFYNSYYKS